MSDNPKYYYIYGRGRCSKNNTKIIQVNKHQYIKIHKRLFTILNKEIIEFPENTNLNKIINQDSELGENQDSELGEIEKIKNVFKNSQGEQLTPEYLKNYNNFALSFKVDATNNNVFVLDKLYLYNSFSYYDFLNIHTLIDYTNLI